MCFKFWNCSILVACAPNSSVTSLRCKQGSKSDCYQNIINRIGWGNVCTHIINCQKLHSFSFLLLRAASMMSWSSIKGKMTYQWPILSWLLVPTQIQPCRWLHVFSTGVGENFSQRTPFTTYISSSKFDQFQFLCSSDVCSFCFQRFNLLLIVKIMYVL